MKKFILKKDGKYYILTHKNNIISEKLFTNENQAIEYFRAYITSWTKSTLILELGE